MRRGRFYALAAMGVVVLVLATLIAVLTPRAGAHAGGVTPPAPNEPMQLRTDVLESYPHDVHAFTEGLLLHRGKLYESTGPTKWSTLREVDLTTGQIIRIVRLPAFFAEGLALKGDRLVQLTYTEGIAFVYKLSTFKKVAEHRYQGQGWGLCFDGARFIMSDGSDRLVVRHPRSFAPIGAINVTARGQPVTKLNELECVRDSIYANVFETDTIVEIGARDGVVRAEIDARNLLSDHEKDCLPAEYKKYAVLNGIAYDEKTATFLVTGKLWPKLFRVRFVPQ
jgi:glutaminyl-peptide cyclotransferase